MEKINLKQVLADIESERKKEVRDTNRKLSQEEIRKMIKAKKAKEKEK